MSHNSNQKTKAKKNVSQGEKALQDMMKAMATMNRRMAQSQTSGRTVV